MATTTATTADIDSPTGFSTLASRAKAWADKNPDQVAMRQKDYGIWRETTWGEAWDTVLTLANGLLALGVDVGDRVSIHSEDL